MTEARYLSVYEFTSKLIEK